MGLSIRAYARHRGVSHVAVKKAIDGGRISLEPDGTLDPEKADADWARNTEPRGPRRTRAAGGAPEAEEAVAAKLPPLGGMNGAGGTTLLQARIANEVLKARHRQLDLEAKRGQKIDRDRAIAQVFKLAREERDAWLNWPNRVAPGLAAQLGVDEHALHVALDAAVRTHLEELGELRPKVDG